MTEGSDISDRDKAGRKRKSYPSLRSTLSVREKIENLNLRVYLYIRAILLKYPTAPNSQNSTEARYVYSHLTQEEAGTECEVTSVSYRQHAAE